jgi:hypothetical protein
MRTVAIVNSRLAVSNDPGNLIRALFECALSQIYVHEINERFSPEGKGLYVPTIVGARCVRDLEDDLPEYMWENPPVSIYDKEIWKIRNDTPYGEKPGRSNPGIVLIEGSELRALLQESKKLWQDLPGVVHAS